MKNKRLTRIAFSILCLTAVALPALSACGKSGFEKFADYITANGVLAENGDFHAISSKNYGTYYSALYYADEEEIAFGLRRTDEARTDALLLIVGKDADICEVLFTRQISGETEPSYAVQSEILPSKPECSKLILAAGSEKEKIDDSMLGVVNGYIDELLNGADVRLLAESGLRMSDLGFAY